MEVSGLKAFEAFKRLSLLALIFKKAYKTVGEKAVN
jgi:hypothetical protein